MARSIEEIVGIFLVVIVGLLFSPTVSLYAATAAGNATGIAATLYPFVPAMYAVLLFLIPVAYFKLRK